MVSCRPRIISTNSVFLSHSKIDETPLPVAVPLDLAGAVYRRGLSVGRNRVILCDDIQGFMRHNKLVRVLFGEIKLDSGGKVVAVRPRPEPGPFFRLSYECHARDIGCDPGGI